MEKTKFGLIVIETFRPSRVRCDGYIVNIEPINEELLQKVFRKFIIHNYNRIPIFTTGSIKSVRYFSAHELNHTLINGRTFLARDLIFLNNPPRVFKTSDFDIIRTLCYAIPRKPTD